MKTEEQNPQSCQTDVSGSVLSDEEMREPIENALYATKRFLTTQATDLAESIIEYLKDAGFTIVRTAANVLRLCVRFFALSECSKLAQYSKAKTDAKPLLCVCGG